MDLESRPVLIVMIYPGMLKDLLDYQSKAGDKLSQYSKASICTYNFPGSRPLMHSSLIAKSYNTPSYIVNETSRPANDDCNFP